MKPFSTLVTISMATLTSALRILPSQDPELCGQLGVMNTSAVPSDIDPLKVRTCAEHPLEDPRSPLVKRDKECWHGLGSLCYKGYCVKSCGQANSGQWCWTALENGFGPWIRCSSPDDCNQGMACGAGPCDSCGCTC